MKAAAVTICVLSALLGLYFTILFARSHSPDRMIMIWPLFVLGLPLTFLGNIVGFALMLLKSSQPWAYALPVILAFLLQWQAIAWWLWSRGR
jgi:hypothetical protein